MLSMDSRETVVYASSFSKTVCPGIRVGYLVGPRELIATVVKIATEHLHLAEHGLAGDRQPVLPLGRDRAIDRDRPQGALHERAHTLCEALERELPDARFVAPDGGYFLWLDLPRGTDVEALFESARRRGVQFVKGSDFVLDGGESSLRLAYSGVTPEEIEEGVKRLAEAYHALAGVETVDAA